MEQKKLVQEQILLVPKPSRSPGKNIFCATILLLLLVPCAYLSLHLDYIISPEGQGPEFIKLRNHCVNVPPIAASEFYQRQTALAQMLHASNASAYIAEPGANALFFGNISQSSWHLSERPFLLIISPTMTADGNTGASVTILTPKFEASRAKFLPIPAQNITWIEWAEDEDPYKKAVSAFSTSTLVGGKIFIAESTRLFVKDGIQAATPHASVVSSSPDIRSLRERKSPAEIALLRCANEVTLLAIRAVRTRMYIGIRQSEARGLIIDALTSAGLTDPSALVLFGENAALPHGSPADRALEKQDFVLFDITGALHGYYSDNTRTFALEESRIPRDHLEIWHSVHRAQQKALAIAEDGAATSAVDEAARTILKQAGYASYFTHRLGHGIGLEVHESPYLRGGSPDIIKTGQTFSDEPGVYIEDKVGVRLEDCFVIEDDGKAVYLTERVGGAAKSPWEP